MSESEDMLERERQVENALDSFIVSLLPKRFRAYVFVFKRSHCLYADESGAIADFPLYMLQWLRTNRPAQNWRLVRFGRHIDTSRHALGFRTKKEAALFRLFFASELMELANLRRSC